MSSIASRLSIYEPQGLGQSYPSDPIAACATRLFWGNRVGADLYCFFQSGPNSGHGGAGAAGSERANNGRPVRSGHWTASQPYRSYFAPLRARHDAPAVIDRAAMVSV
jgi:hypothetical protein